MSISAVSESSKANSCAQCGNSENVISRCGQCALAYYCNETCQRKHWREHRKTCVIPGNAVLSQLTKLGFPKGVSGVVLSCLPQSQVAIPQDPEAQAWTERADTLKASGGILKEYATALERQGVKEGDAAKRAYTVAVKWIQRFPEECRNAGMDPHQPTFEQIVRAGEGVKDAELIDFFKDLAFKNGGEMLNLYMEGLQHLKKKEFAARIRKLFQPPIETIPLDLYQVAAEMIPLLKLNEDQAVTILEYACYRGHPVEPFSMYAPFQNISLLNFGAVLEKSCGQGQLEIVRGFKTWPQVQNANYDQVRWILQPAFRSASRKGQLEILRELKTWPQSQKFLSQQGVSTLAELFVAAYEGRHLEVVEELKGWPEVRQPERFSLLFQGACDLRSLKLLRELKNWPQMKDFKVKESDYQLSGSICKVFEREDQEMVAEVKALPLWQELDIEGFLTLLRATGHSGNAHFIRELKNHPLFVHVPLQDVRRVIPYAEEEVVNELIATPQFMSSAPDQVASTIEESIFPTRHATIRKLMAVPQFSQISSKALSEILRLAREQNCPSDIIQSLEFAINTL